MWEYISVQPEMYNENLFILFKNDLLATKRVIHIIKWHKLRSTPNLVKSFIKTKIIPLQTISIVRKKYDFLFGNFGNIFDVKYI